MGFGIIGSLNTCQPSHRGKFAGGREKPEDRDSYGEHGRTYVQPFSILGRGRVSRSSAAPCSLFLNDSGDARGACHEQGLHFSTARHLRVRWLKAVTQFSLRDLAGRGAEAVRRTFQRNRLAERDSDRRDLEKPHRRLQAPVVISALGRPGGEPLAIYYAFKQSEVGEDGITSAGWASFE
jgi:hypothetical protein